MKEFITNIPMKTEAVGLVMVAEGHTERMQNPEQV
jgi:hypothetical protein